MEFRTGGGIDLAMNDFNGLQLDTEEDRSQQLQMSHSPSGPLIETGDPYANPSTGSGSTGGRRRLPKPISTSPLSVSELTIKTPPETEEGVIETKGPSVKSRVATLSQALGQRFSTHNSTSNLEIKSNGEVQSRVTDVVSDSEKEKKIGKEALPVSYRRRYSGNFLVDSHKRREGFAHRQAASQDSTSPRTLKKETLIPLSHRDIGTSKLPLPQPRTRNGKKSKPGAISPKEGTSDFSTEDEDGRVTPQPEATRNQTESNRRSNATTPVPEISNSLGGLDHQTNNSHDSISNQVVTRGHIPVRKDRRRHNNNREPIVNGHLPNGSLKKNESTGSLLLEKDLAKQDSHLRHCIACANARGLPYPLGHEHYIQEGGKAVPGEFRSKSHDRTLKRRRRKPAHNKESPRSLTDHEGSQKDLKESKRRSFPSPARTATSGGSDVNSTTSGGSGGQLSSREIAKRRSDLKHAQTLDEKSGYMTPRQRMEKEVKELKKEVSKLLRDNEQKDAEVFAMRCQVDGEKKIVEEEKDRQIVQLTTKLGQNEKEKFEDKEELFALHEELAKMDEKYTQLKVEMQQKEEKFEEYLLFMYKKGQQVAMFEREEELEMLARNPNSNKVSVVELTNRLSKTEMELAKWQGLRLQESYSSQTRPETQDEATVSFLRDSFYHFFTDKEVEAKENHLRAILKILKYSEVQLGQIAQSLDAFKSVNKKKVFREIKYEKGKK